VSKLPVTWIKSSLNDVCNVVNGGTPKTGVDSYWDGKHYWVTPAEMGKRSNPYISETRRKLTNDGLGNTSAKLVPPFSVILSTRAPIGHLVINKVPMAFNQGCRGLVPNDDLNYRFLYYFLMNSISLLNDLGTGATFKELSAGKLKAVNIPVPPLLEQQRIVSILDKAFKSIDQAIANTEKNLVNARELFERSIDEYVFKDCTQWEKTSVELVAKAEKGSMRTGPFGSQLLKHEFVDKGIPVIGIDNVVKNYFRWGKKRFISNQKFDELSRFQVKANDVLITIMGTCGRCAIVPDDIPTSINTKHLCCITLDQNKCLPEYLHLYFLHNFIAKNYLLSKSKGAIMAGLNMGIIKELPLFLPNIETQRALVEKINQFSLNTEKLIFLYTTKIKSLAELKQSLLQKAFAGQLS